MSKVPQFAAGELVNVAIRGARVTEPQPATHGEALYLSVGAHHFAMPTDSAHVTVERVAPAEYPPQAGDTWRDGRGMRWFAFAPVAGEKGVILRPEADFRLWSYPEDVLKDWGPLALVHREGWTPPTETTPAEPDEYRKPTEAEMRAERIAGLRLLADFLEQHPEISVPYIHPQTYYSGDEATVRAAIQRDADALGVTLTERLHTDGSGTVVISGSYEVNRAVSLSLHASVKSTKPEQPTPERVEVGVDGCGCAVTEEIAPNGSSIEGTERTEHRTGCWAVAEPLPHRKPDAWVDETTGLVSGGLVTDTPPEMYTEHPARLGEQVEDVTA